MATAFSFQAYVYLNEGQPLGRSLEQVVGPMASLDGLFFEWDGSLTWANQSEGWQIDGMVYDNATEIQYVDLHGRISRAENAILLHDRLRQLFGTWGDPADLMLLRLPDRRWQTLQDFERELLSKSASTP